VRTWAGRSVQTETFISGLETSQHEIYVVLDVFMLKEIVFTASRTFMQTELLIYMYNMNTIVNATILFVVLCLSYFTQHVSAVTGHHQVYFHLRSCHTACNLK
jgi:hypothetical protein